MPTVPVPATALAETMELGVTPGDAFAPVTTSPLVVVDGIVGVETSGVTMAVAPAPGARGVLLATGSKLGLNEGVRLDRLLVKQTTPGNAGTFTFVGAVRDISGAGAATG